MKHVFVFLFCGFSFLEALCAGTGVETNKLTEMEAAGVKQKLKAFEAGKVDLVEAAGDPDAFGKVVSFYLLHTNEVSVKMKLPINYSFLVSQRVPEAAKLAQEYINVYSNDFQGWSVLAAAEMGMQSYEEALAAATNAVRLGHEDNDYSVLGLVALKLYRMDVLESTAVPHLLVQKDKQMDKDEKLDMVGILLNYSLQAQKEEVFLRALDGVDFKDIVSQERLKRPVEFGCKLFKGEGVEKICRELEAAAGKHPAKQP